MPNPNPAGPERSALPEGIRIGEAKLSLRPRIMENRAAEAAGEPLLMGEEIDDWLDGLDEEDRLWWESIQAARKADRKPGSRGI